jgi:hypothetical protein
MFILKCENCKYESTINLENNKWARQSFGVNVFAYDGQLVFECINCGQKLDEFNQDHIIKTY